MQNEIRYFFVSFELNTLGSDEECYDIVSIVSFSLFVLLKGATKEQAFNIGKDIVDTVTAMNPKPVKLKFEKVWLNLVPRRSLTFSGEREVHVRA